MIYKMVAINGNNYLPKFYFAKFSSHLHYLCRVSRKTEGQNVHLTTTTTKISVAWPVVMDHVTQGALRVGVAE